VMPGICIRTHSARVPSLKVSPAIFGEQRSSTDRVSLTTEGIMLVTLVAILCNGQLCLDKVVTTSEQSGITMSACQVGAQMGIAEWLANGPYHDWKLQGYKCFLGRYTPKNQA